MTDLFIADVVSIGPIVIAPRITEHDGTPHKQVKAIARDGITVKSSDVVLVATMKNNRDMSFIKRIFSASASNCVIIGVMSTDEFVLTGDYKFIGNLTVNGDIILNGISIKDHVHSAGTYTAGATSVTLNSGKMV